jgi:GH25 family lysozyme M1 (1,4-beta-N-acetylmuramidase)
MALFWPVNAPVTQQFGSNPNSIQPNGHTGMDFGVPVGTSVKAAGAGTVVFANWATTLSANNPWWIAPAFAGICVVIDHGNGQLTLYAHLNSTTLNAGNRVTQGQEIGKSGNTGLSTGPHLHFEVLGWPLAPYNGFYGRLNPTKYVTAAAAPIVLKPNERRTGASTVNQRAAANNDSKIVRVIPAKSTEVFTGYVIGEMISGINIWYKDAQGYAWAGGFETQTTSGLPNVTPPPPLKANERMVGPDNANLRSQPNDSAPVLRVIPANSKEVFTGYVVGEMIKGINVWYKDAQGYTWSGGFTSQSMTGLPNLTPKPPVTPPTPPVPTEADRTRIAGATSVNQRALPFIGADVVRVIPAGSKEIFTGYVIGDPIESTDVWFKDSQGYAWAGAFTSQAVTGLTKDVTPAKPTPPVVTPPVVTPPVVTPPVVPAPVTTLKGVDISGHQPGLPIMDLDADFVIIKASEGVDWEDPQLKSHVANARAANKLVGFYHFARPLATVQNTAQAEAQSFVNIIKPVLKDGDVLVLDWEAENQSNFMWAEAWLDTVKDLTGANPLIYMNLSTANAYNWTSVSTKYKLWLAQYPSSAKQGWGPNGNHGVAKDWDVVMWQYTSTGNISGWSADLDLNIFYGNERDWTALGATSSPIAPAPGPVTPSPVDPAEKARLMEILEAAIDQYLAEKQ